MKIRYKICFLLICLFSLNCACRKESGTISESSSKVKARKIYVLESNGDTEVTRNKNSSVLRAYEGMNLIDGDSIAVLTRSSLTMKTDTRRYLKAEENTCFSLSTSGKGDNQKTVISLSKGSTLLYIDKKLKENETYEVHTPNSVMSVRGTVFSVTVEQTGDNESTEKVEVLDGTVLVSLLKDGKKTNKEILVTEGYEISLLGQNGEGSFLTEDIKKVNDFSEKKEKADKEAEIWAESPITAESLSETERKAAESVPTISPTPIVFVTSEPKEDSTENSDIKDKDDQLLKSFIPAGIEGFYQRHVACGKEATSDILFARAFFQNKDEIAELVFCSLMIDGCFRISEKKVGKTNIMYSGSADVFMFNDEEYTDVNISLWSDIESSNNLLFSITAGEKKLLENQIVTFKKAITEPMYPEDMTGIYECSENTDLYSVARIELYYDSCNLLCAEIQTPVFHEIIKGLLYESDGDGSYSGARLTYEEGEGLAIFDDEPKIISLVFSRGENGRFDEVIYSRKYSNDKLEQSRCIRR